MRKNSLTHKRACDVSFVGFLRTKMNVGRFVRFITRNTAGISELVEVMLL